MIMQSSFTPRMHEIKKFSIRKCVPQIALSASDLTQYQYSSI